MWPQRDPISDSCLTGYKRYQWILRKMNGPVDDSISFSARSSLTLHFTQNLIFKLIVSDPAPRASLEIFSVDKMLMTSDETARSSVEMGWSRTANSWPSSRDWHLESQLWGLWFINYKSRLLVIETNKEKDPHWPGIKRSILEKLQFVMNSSFALPHIIMITALLFSDKVWNWTSPV